MFVATCLLAWLGIAGWTPISWQLADARDAQRRQQQIKAQIERQQAELKRRSADLQRKNPSLNRALPKSSPPPPPGYNEHRAKVLRDFENQAAGRQAAQQATAFRPANAPRPEACWQEFVNAARGARTFDPLLKYMPLEKQDSLKRSQAGFDPRAAAERKAARRRSDPQMSEETLEHLTSSPYAYALKFHKSIAEKYIAVLSVQVEGNKATLKVSTKNGGVIDGVQYPYGTAKVELLGQGNFWRLSSYGDDNTAYREVPQR